MFSKLISVSILVLSLLGAGCVAGEVNDDAICLTHANLAFPAAPPEVALFGSFGPVERPFDVDLSDQLSQLIGGSGMDTTGSTIFLTHLTIVAKSGLPDFSFLDSLSVSARAKTGASSVEPVSIVKYARGAAIQASPLNIPADTVDLFTMLSKGPVTFTVGVSGAVPTVDWSVDLTFCFALGLKVKKTF